MVISGGFFPCLSHHSCISIQVIYWAVPNYGPELRRFEQVTYLARRYFFPLFYTFVA
jgi:hypothetical protein